MSHNPQTTIKQIFSHPIPMNIKWSEVVHMFQSLGGTVEPTHAGRGTVRLNGKQITLHVPHGKAIDSRDEVVKIRHFLESAGVEPADR